MLLPETSLQIAIRLAEKMRQLIQKNEFRYSETSIRATISVGVASLMKEVKTVQQFLELADQALYRAKKSGRNRVSS